MADIIWAGGLVGYDVAFTRRRSGDYLDTLHVTRIRASPGPPLQKTQGQKPMPKQIYDVEKFLGMTEDAVECRVKRSADQVKLKLRTSRYLYTLILEPQKAEEVLSQVKCTVVEARPQVEEE